MPHRVAFLHRQPLFDTAATRRIEVAAQSRLPPHTLMQRAGLALARLTLALAPHARQVWIACGPGNNGGDGLEAAAHLQRWGLNTVVTWLGTPDESPADARAAWQRARDAGVAFADAPPERLDANDLAIDALLGIGASRPPAGAMAQWLQRLHDGPAPVLAVDLPSGLNADTGVMAVHDATQLIAINGANRSNTSQNVDVKVPGAGAVRHTLALLTLKPGLFTGQGRDACGTLWFDDLGVSADPLAVPTAWLASVPAPSARPHDSHKGSFGDVGVIGGTCDAPSGTSMAGAALLAASAALHGGAGRVYVTLLGSGGPSVDVAQPEIMFRHLDTMPLEAMTVVCGCGGGDAVRCALPDVLAQAPRLVLDADGLNAVAQDAALQAMLTARSTRGQPTVLTPHPLEAARLLATDTRQVQADRLGAAQALATRFACVTVLKGSGSVIAAPAEVPRVNPSGNARLATPGSGDVLAGLIGARMASGRAAFDAACTAVFDHGVAADNWPAGQTLTASALARRLAF